MDPKFILDRPNWLTPVRSNQAELLEQGLGSRQDVGQNLREMERINRRLGGLAAITTHLYPRLAASGREKTLRVLDFGTGSAGLPRLIAGWARRRRAKVQLIGLDHAARNLQHAARWSAGEPGLRLLLAEALQPPFSARGVDFSISTLLLHHLSPAQVIELLQRAYHLSACSLIFSDLVRGWLPYFAFKLASPVLARHPFTRHDGALSVRRAYTPGELLRLAQAAGLQQAQVVKHFPWRMTLIVDRQRWSLPFVEKQHDRIEAG